MLPLAQPASGAPWDAIRPSAIRAHVEFLADDLLEGRAAASRGHDIAAAYVAAQFQQSGLLPAGEADSFFQPVPLLEATPVLPGSSAEWVFAGGSHVFEYGIDYLPSADFESASSTLSAPLVFAGFGVEAPELQHDDFANIDVKGRIVVVLSGAPAKFPDHQRAYYSWPQRKAATLLEHGAVGVIHVDSLEDSRRIPWERRVAMSWTSQMRWLNEQGEPQNTYPQLKLQFRFNHAAAAYLFEQSPASLPEVLATAETGDAQGFELPGMLTLSATTGLRRTQSSNVIAVYPGADAQLKDEYIVLSAHLDHLGRGSAVDGDSIYNGAHDNAAGVAILLEIAHALHASKVRSRRSLLIAAVTAQEKGLLGSDFLVHSARAANRRIVANINIDMPLIFAPLQDFVAIGARHSTLGVMARSAAASQGYQLASERFPEELRLIRGDQFSFIRRGIPALALTGGYRARDNALDLEQMRRQFRASRHHQPGDDLSLPMDYRTMADLGKVNLRIALAAADASARPHWQPGDFFARIFAHQE
ncbi:hypothetical protein ACG33_12510 [Steroidobacter denitrificans]|uniref:Peptidase M28 domain-containing protein n=1 Tax=Steroidobacter denitrificans TaxID=465721 RepID=A0A127FBW5_STEDE|nr:hypothetical protein ACG33_12510 [Steroidobacter denitrificans]